MSRRGPACRPCGGGRDRKEKSLEREERVSGIAPRLCRWPRRGRRAQKNPRETGLDWSNHIRVGQWSGAERSPPECPWYRSRAMDRIRGLRYADPPYRTPSIEKPELPFPGRDCWPRERRCRDRPGLFVQPEL